MRHSVISLPEFPKRLAAGRPVMTRDQITSLAARILGMTRNKIINLSVEHTARATMQMANGRIIASDDGDRVNVRFNTTLAGQYFVSFRTNQLDDDTLLDAVRQCEALSHAGFDTQDSPLPDRINTQDLLVPVQHWHQATVDAMSATRETIVPRVLNIVQRQGLRGAGFLGFMARAEAWIKKDGNISYYHEETDSEMTVTARTSDGRRSGWGGQASRDWTQIDPDAIAQRAVEMAVLAGAPVAVEPGRRTAILEPEAVVQILRRLTEHFQARSTDMGETALSKYPPPRGGNKLRQQIFDTRITMRSDPADPDGGYRPFFDELNALGNPVMTWVEHGILKNMAYDQTYAMQRGKAYADVPYSFRMSGGETLIEQMIASCKEGIYVNRFSDVELLDLHSGMTTGVTRDGCFLIKDGKISQAIKNLRFLDSPFFFLNQIEALGVPRRAAFGYTPAASDEWSRSAEWPRVPIIVPPMMVNDFNFSGLAEAV